MVHEIGAHQGFVERAFLGVFRADEQVQGLGAIKGEEGHHDYAVLAVEVAGVALRVRVEVGEGHCVAGGGSEIVQRAPVCSSS